MTKPNHVRFVLGTALFYLTCLPVFGDEPVTHPNWVAPPQPATEQQAFADEGAGGVRLIDQSQQAGSPAQDWTSVV